MGQVLEAQQLNCYSSILHHKTSCKEWTASTHNVTCMADQGTADRQDLQHSRDLPCLCASLNYNRLWAKSGTKILAFETF